MEKTSPDPDQILVAEFNYIAQSAFQANEDRSRATSFYFVSFGSFIAAILTQVLDARDPAVYWGFSILFLFLAILALLTILQLVRLRKAWFEAARAMNQIKDYYIRHGGEKKLAEAFRWRAHTLPPVDKGSTISMYLVVEVALVGAASLGACWFFIMLGFGMVSWGIAVPLAAVYLFAELFIYRRLLKDDREPGKTAG